MRILQIYRPLDGEWLHIGSQHENGLFFGQRSLSSLCKARLHNGLDFLERSISNGFTMAVIEERPFPDLSLLNIDDEIALIAGETGVTTNGVRGWFNSLKQHDGEIFRDFMNILGNSDIDHPIALALYGRTQQILRGSFGNTVTLYSGAPRNFPMTKWKSVVNGKTLSMRVGDTSNTFWFNESPESPIISKGEFNVQDIMYFDGIVGCDRQHYILVSPDTKVLVYKSTLDENAIEEYVPEDNQKLKKIRLQENELAPNNTITKSDVISRYFIFDKQNLEHIQWLSSR